MGLMGVEISYMIMLEEANVIASISHLGQTEKIRNVISTISEVE